MTQVDPSVLDVFYRCLADHRRRFVLSHLLNEDDRSVTFGELVDGVMRSEPDSASSDRASIAESLYHQHLPLLAEHGLVDYESDRDIVRKTDRTDQMGPLIAVVESFDREPGFDPLETESRR